MEMLFGIKGTFRRVASEDGATTTALRLQEQAGLLPKR